MTSPYFVYKMTGGNAVNRVASDHSEGTNQMPILRVCNLLVFKKT